MKKKLIFALCAVLCVLLGAGAGYLIGQAEYSSSPFSDILSELGFDKDNPPLIADADAAAALAEAYYRENVDQDGSNPRLAGIIAYAPQAKIWRVSLSPEEEVLKEREAFPTHMTVGDSYDLQILAADGTILSAQWGE